MTLLNEDHVQTLSTICNIDHDTARKILLKHNGNLEKAVNARLARDDTDDEIPPLEPPSVIDLTGDDHEYQRALQLSMESSRETNLVPTDRAPHPDWQLVRSNV